MTTSAACEINSPTEVYAYATLLIILAVLSSIGNLVLIIIIYKHPRMQTPSFLCIGVLAVLNCASAAINAPIKSAVLVTDDTSLFIVLLWLTATVLFLSISTLVLLTVDRLFHVYFLDRYRRTKRKFCVEILMSWMAPIGLLIMAFAPFRLWVIIYLFPSFFIFCILSMLLAYIGIFLTLRRYTYNVEDAVRRNYIESQVKAVNTTLMIALCYVAMNVPSLVSVVLGFREIPNALLCTGSYFAMLLSSIVIPVICFVRISGMRRRVVVLLRLQGDDEEEMQHDF